MKASYKKIFSINVFHNYFEDGICKNIRCRPIGITRTLFLEYGLRLESVKKGFNIYLPCNLNLEDFLNYLETTSSQKSFYFELISKDSSFYQITDFPIGKNGYYFATTAHMLENNDAKIFIKKFEKHKDSESFCKLEIEFVNIKSSHNNYKLKFDARRTEWNYLIINKKERNYHELFFEGVPNIEFSNPQTVILDNMQSAQSFLSKSTIALKEHPKYKLNLVGKYTKLGITKTQIIYKGVPNPNPSISEIVKVGNKSIVRSLIYMYI